MRSPNISDELQDLIHSVSEARRRKMSDEAIQPREAELAAVQKYAEDFGQTAADRLLAYARLEYEQNAPAEEPPKGRRR